MDRLGAAVRRVLAEDIHAPIDLPPFDNSSVDGFALTAADLQQPSPLHLKVSADIPAGASPSLHLQAGESARVMTGAPIPLGAAAVVMVEDTDFNYRQAGATAPATVTVHKMPSSGENIRPHGMDLHQGDKVLSQGTHLRAQELGLLAMLGVARVKVHRLPRLALLSSGDELLPVEAPLTPGKIHDANTYILSALVEGTDAELIPLGIAADTEADVRSRMEQAAASEAAWSGDAPDMVFLDIKMPGMDGLDVLSRIKAISDQLPVVMISGHGTVSTAVEATKLGAFDFIEKPLASDRVLLTIRNGLEGSRLRDENRSLRRAVEVRHEMVGNSPAVKQIVDAVRRAAPTNATVLIQGESGVGKELVARMIHRNSLRSRERFVQVNCAAIPEELIESELFGHEKGSFTGATEKQIGKFEQADRGTIFLDEIGDMSLKTQAKVLRVLQEREFERVGGSKPVKVDVRLICATNRDLERMVKRGKHQKQQRDASRCAGQQPDERPGVYPRGAPGYYRNGREPQIERARDMQIAQGHAAYRHQRRS